MSGLILFDLHFNQFFTQWQIFCIFSFADHTPKQLPELQPDLHSVASSFSGTESYSFTHPNQMPSQKQVYTKQKTALFPSLSEDDDIANYVDNLAPPLKKRKTRQNSNQTAPVNGVMGFPVIYHLSSPENTDHIQAISESRDEKEQKKLEGEKLVKELKAEHRKIVRQDLKKGKVTNRSGRIKGACQTLFEAQKKRVTNPRRALVSTRILPRVTQPVSGGGQERGHGQGTGQADGVERVDEATATRDTQPVSGGGEERGHGQGTGQADGVEHVDEAAATRVTQPVSRGGQKRGQGSSRGHNSGMASRTRSRKNKTGSKRCLF